jgi:hypothetical protein
MREECGGRAMMVTTTVMVAMEVGVVVAWR